MAKFQGTLSGAIVVIDKGQNTFVNGVCVNPLKDSDVTLAERASEEMNVEPMVEIIEKVEVTGHVASFSYGTNPDNDDKPYEVNTGHKSW